MPQTEAAVETPGPLDAAPLARWLAGALPQLGPLERILQVEGGQSNPTYCLECAEGRVALRKQPPGKLLPSAHRIDREWRFLEALGAARPIAVPVPCARAWCDDPTIVGTRFYIMDWVEGRSFQTPVLAELAPAARWRAFADCFRTLGALHAIRPAAVGLESLGRPEGYVARQIARWSAQYDASATRDSPAMTRLRARLAEWRPSDSPPAIVHGDYRMANLIFAPDRERVVAVVDWELATIGHPLADLAYACAAFRCAPGTPGFPGIHGLATHGSGYPDEEEMITLYTRAGGMPVPPDWERWIAYAMFRLAAIAGSVYRRGLDRQASSSNWRDYGPAIEALAELGMEAIESA